MDKRRDSGELPVVLVAEDETLLRLYAAEALEDAGYKIIAVKDANEALDVMKTTPQVRVLFTDIQMPGPLNGVELARKVHQHWPNVLLLITSGNVTLTPAEIPDHGHFVQKPYSIQEVVEQIQSLTEEADKRKLDHGPKPGGNF